MQLIHSKAQFDLVNIESVFAAIELGKLMNVNFNLNVDLDTISDSVNFLIYKTIELKTKFYVVDLKLVIPHPYDNFLKLVKNYVAKSGYSDIAIITFNYDVALDCALELNNFNCSYGLPTYLASPSVALLKLHGSINWGICPKCESIIPWPMHEYLGTFKSQWSYIDTKGKPIIISPGSNISYIQCRRCNCKVANRPFIVPPTWNKTQYHSKISEVWSQAANHLSEAENIFIIGYSLPDTDYFFHYLYALGTMGKSRLKEFWVCNPDSQVDKKFQGILGQQARDRYRFLDEKFDMAINIIRQTLI
jgi:hypothetical protein